MEASVQSSINVRLKIVVTVQENVSTILSASKIFHKFLLKRMRIMVERGDFGLISIGLILKINKVKFKQFIKWLQFLRTPMINKQLMKSNIKIRIGFICLKKGNLLGIELLFNKKDIISFLFPTLMQLRSEFIALKFQDKLNFQGLLLILGKIKISKEFYLYQELLLSNFHKIDDCMKCLQKLKEQRIVFILSQLKSLENHKGILTKKMQLATINLLSVKIHFMNF